MVVSHRAKHSAARGRVAAHLLVRAAGAGALAGGLALGSKAASLPSPPAYRAAVRDGGESGTTGSPLFHPFRALGYVTAAVPFAVQRRGRATFLTVSAGKAWQLYNCAKLTLVLVGQPLERSITALACKDDFTFAAYGPHVAVFRRAHRVGTWRGSSGDVVALLPLGELVLSLTREGVLTAWPLRSPDALEPAHPALQLPPGFQPSCWCHPDAYLNKVLLGAADGRLALCNFVAGRLVHLFPGFGAPVRCLAVSPALDVVGVGLQDGRALLHNIRFDETLAAFTHDATGGAVTALAFRTGPGQPLMVAGGLSGTLSVWDLDAKRLQALIQEAHDAAVISLHFFAGEPVLMSSGGDNAVKQWIFDGEDGAARLLRFRSGHAAPPCCVRFYGEGRRLLSAGSDRAFRVFSTVQDQQSRELSQRNVEHRAKKLRVTQEELKLSPVTALASCQLRERDWCNVVTVHSGCPAAYTWRLAAGALGEHALTPPRSSGAPVTCCAVSACGNYALLGSDCGDVDRFNLQSGLHRGGFTRPLQPPGAPRAQPAVKPGKARAFWAMAGPRREVEGGACAHEGAVTLVDSDACNARLVTAGRDGAVRLWAFKTRALLGEAQAGCPVERGVLHRGSGLLACACADAIVRVFDTSAEQPRRVRSFGPHGDAITDLTFSEDARWLLSASMDGVLRVWDLPAGRLLQALRLGGAPITALALSPEMDMLATAHMGKRGIYLWANRLVFSAVGESELAPPPAPGAAPLLVRAPGVGEGAPLSDEEQEDEDVPAGVASLVEAERAEGEEGPLGEAPLALQPALPPAKAQLAPRMVTLALLPRAQWQALLHLETLRERGKPVAPPEKPQAAPFFLPTLPSLAPHPVFDTAAAQPGAAQASRVARVGRDADGGAASRSPLLRAVAAGALLRPPDYAQAVRHLQASGASALDAELRGLTLASPDAEALSEGDEAALGAVLRFFAVELRRGTAFELLHAALAAFLRIHADACAASPRLRRRAARLQQEARLGWTRLDRSFQNARCVLAFLSGLGQA